MTSLVATASVESLPAGRSLWHKLLPGSAANTVFSHPDWLEIWWKHLGQGWNPLIVVVRAGPEVLGLAPLMARDDVLSFLGGGDVCDYLDVAAVLGREPETLGALLDFVEEGGWRTIRLQSLPAHSPTIHLLPDLARRRGWAVEVTEEDTAPAVDLPGTWEGYLSGLSKKDRHELRRKLRRLQAAGEIAVTEASQAGRLDEDVSDFLRLHRLSATEKAAFMSPEMEQFFRAVASRFVPSGDVRLYFLELNGQRVSAAWCFDQGDELWLYNSGYDHAYASLAVGLLLQALCIQQAIAAGKRRFDFLRGREPYKYDLGGRDRPVFRVEMQR